MFRTGWADCSVRLLRGAGGGHFSSGAAERSHSWDGAQDGATPAVSPRYRRGRAVALQQSLGHTRVRETFLMFGCF